VTVRLTRGALEIRDDGGGFDPEAGARDGLGLASMRERAAAVGGALTIESSGAGTVVRLEVPA
jgi:signal transduction histidine kinase